jgi:hypothetical protein
MATTGPSNWRILVDIPTKAPALEFSRWATVLAQIISTSEPRFAVGIFGPWGCGKTTLMEAIEDTLDSRRTISIRFNAWRYERETNLVIPLIDVMRDAIATWGDRNSDARANWAAVALGRLALQLGRAMTVRVAATGPSIAVNLAEVLKPLPSTGDSMKFDEATHSQSLYHAAFHALGRVVSQFTHSPPHPDTRLVIFVDDLDRCLPSSMLAVLEAMKLLFDTRGIVFVIGVDPRVLQRAIDDQYRRPESETDLLGGSNIDAAQYLNKIFQVPFTLPRVSKAGLRSLVDVMCQELPEDQRSEVMHEVIDHVAYLGESDVNPRDVKRFINAYTLQAQLAPDGDRIGLLIALLLKSKPRWTALYELLYRDPAAFRALARHLIDESNPRPGTALGIDVTSDFVEYVKQFGVRLLAESSLPEIVADMELAGRREPLLADATARLQAVSVLLARADISDWPGTVRGLVDSLSGRLKSAVGGSRAEPHVAKYLELLYAEVAEAEGANDDDASNIHRGIARSYVEALINYVATIAAGASAV